MEKNRDASSLEELNDRMVWLFKQGQYQEAVREARKTYKRALETYGEGHPALEICLNNLREAHHRQRQFQEEKELEQRRAQERLQEEALARESSRTIQGVISLVLVLGVVFGYSLLSIARTSLGEQGQGDTRTRPVPVGITGGGEHSRDKKLKKSVLLEVPIVSQLPRLPRGCEVTSLAMLLDHAGVPVDKMILAEQVAKDPAPLQVIRGQVHYGNPYQGFVGCMYSLDNPGLGVYHGPIRDLLEECLPGRARDLTGGEFEEVLYSLSQGVPVWVIVNARYRELEPGSFNTWQTGQGPVEITYNMHAVLLTGYDRQYVYFNDPLTAMKNRKKCRESFQVAWEQMGRQAVTYQP